MRAQVHEVHEVCARVRSGQGARGVQGAQGARGVRAARLLFLTATGGETLPTVWAPASSVSTFRENE